MHLQPLHDRLVVKRVERDNKTAGGIVIPDTASEKPMWATVVAVGAGRRGDNGERRALCVAAGDRVLIGKYAGTEVKVDGEDLVVLREDDVMAIDG